jgi:hypothetical protein
MARRFAGGSISARKIHAIEELLTGEPLFQQLHKYGGLPVP